MLCAITLVCLLLPLLAGGSAAQQDLLCTDNYAEFESASVGSNVSGSDIRNQLYKVFYAPNQHLPYSVVVTYKLVLANGTRLNLSSDPNCSTELWMWLSSPVFLVGNTEFFNQILFFTLGYFMEWDPPHVTINLSVPPCPSKSREYFSVMTATVSLCTNDDYVKL